MSVRWAAEQLSARLVSGMDNVSRVQTYTWTSGTAPSITFQKPWFTSWKLESEVAERSEAVLFKPLAVIKIEL